MVSPSPLRALLRFPLRSRAHVVLAVTLALVPTVAASTALGVTAPARPSSAPAAAPGFVTRSGSSLTLGGRPFRFSGANLYWTGLDENVGGVDPDGPRAVGYPSFFRIRDGLRTARQLGLSVVRAHTVGISTGGPESLEPSYGATNPAAWDTMDYTVAQAGRLGLRLIVPLTDNWSYYHGGRYDFLRWLGLSTADHGSAFYTDARARSAYQAYVRGLLTHVNRFTGLRYADDPTIMAWELGNEMDDATPDWVQSNALFVKGLAPSQLVAAGRSWRVDEAVTASSAVDISDSHYYPLDVAAVREDAAAVTAAGKVFIVGEYPSTEATDANLSALADDPQVSGAAVWSLFPHADHYGFVQHDDGYTMHAPGDTPAMQAAVSSIVRFGAALAAGAAGVSGPAVTTGPDVGLVEPPVITAVSAPSSPGGRQLRWRGSAGAGAYRVEWTAGRTTSVGPLLPAQVTSWAPPPSAGDSTYVVSALDASGRTLSRSSPLRAPVAGGAVTDVLEDFYVTSGHSDGLVRTPRAGAVAVAPAAGGAGWMTWSAAGATAARFVLSGSVAAPPVVETQSGSGAWVRVAATSVTRDSGAYAVSVALVQAAAVRLSWPTGSAFALTRVVLTTG
ncbi:MAG: hypothetical protein M3Y71_00990 [Actinomycetota bacterium]|nr:hypothetical protein [Actinomycetota bacterium]